MEDYIYNAKKIKLLIYKISHYERIIICNKYLKFFYNIFYLYLDLILFIELLLCMKHCRFSQKKVDWAKPPLFLPKLP